MSLDALIDAFKNPHYKLANRLIQLAIADTVSEGHDWLYFGGDDLLAAKANVDEKTVRRAKTLMVADGYLIDLHRRHENGNRLYRYVMHPENQLDNLSNSQVDISSQPTGQKTPSNRTNRDSHYLSTQEEHKRTAKPTDDPLDAHAQTLTVLAFEQPVKPALRSGGNPFSAAKGIIKSVLLAGVPVGDVERAIRTGVDVWTLAGLQTAIAKSKPASSPRNDSKNFLLDRIGVTA